MTLHDDRTFVRHFSWVILFLAAMLIIFIILSFVIVSVSGVESHSGYSYVQYMNKHPAAAPAATASGQAQAATARTSASGQTVAANGSKSANGQSVWEAHCATCHKTGVAGAPKIGDQAVWATIFKKTDHATLYKHAIEGFHGERGFMPPKGGATGLSDAQVKAAVDYMINKSGWQSD